MCSAMLLPKKATYQVLHHMTLIAAFHESRSLGSKFTALGKITKLPTVAPAIGRAVGTKGAGGPHILADHLTLSQTGGLQIMPTTLLLDSPSP